MWVPLFSRPPCVLRSCIVNLKSGDTVLRGILWRTHGPWFVFRNAAGLKPNQPPMPIDGDVVIARENIDFIQVLP